MKILYTNLARFFALTICLTLVYACGSKQSGPQEEGDTLQTSKSGEHALRFVLDTDSSYVCWVGRSVVDRHFGQIPFSEGVFFVEKDTLSGGVATVDIGQLRVAHPEDKEQAAKLRTHLLSVDFFEVEKYPTAHVEYVAIAPYDSSAFQPAHTGHAHTEHAHHTGHAHTEKYDSLDKKQLDYVPTHNITANISIRGTKRTVVFPARFVLDKDSLVLEAEFDIDRTEFGITYREESSVVDKLKDKFIYNTVNVGVFLHAKLEQDTSAVQVDKTP